MNSCFKVVAALIEKNGKVLITQRKKEDVFGLKWEFPGGKVKEGESLEEALKREIREELGIDVQPYEFVKSFRDKSGDIYITVHLFRCRITKGRISSLECEDYKFLDLENIKRFNLAPVDRKIYSYLLKNLKHGK